MTSIIFSAIAVSVFITAVISGTFGMAGGMILMAVLLQLLPLAAAMSLHAAVQLVSNGWRCFLWRRHIVWHVLPFYALGMLAGFGVVAATGFVPNKAFALITIGSVPLLAMIVHKFMTITIMNKWHAFFAAVCLTFVHMTSGVVGALLDLLYNNTVLTRQQIVATKAFTQTVSHLLRLVYFGALVSLITGNGQWSEYISTGHMLLFVFVSIAGTTMAAFVLHQIHDGLFKKIGRWLIAAVSLYCLVRGIYMM